MTLDKEKTQKYIQLYLPKEDIFTKMAFWGCPHSPIECSSSAGTVKRGMK